ncbi:MAG: hypothetical protein COA79_10430 [Planctomycetota bacterium]|nr:MAG: hypothetical protein COA79_10430 [Planctomycetota bacterium]
MKKPKKKCKICQDSFQNIRTHITRGHKLSLKSYEKKYGLVEKPYKNITNKKEFDVYFIKLAKKAEPRSLTISMVDPEMLKLAVLYHGSWDKVKAKLNLKKSSSTNAQILKTFKDSYANRIKEPKKWRTQCKYAIDRYGTMVNAYKKAGIKREHLDEITFLKNFKLAFNNRNNGKEEYASWRLYSQKAFTKYKSLSKAYKKAGINNKKDL